MKNKNQKNKDLEPFVVIYEPNPYMYALTTLCFIIMLITGTKLFLDKCVTYNQKIANIHDNRAASL